MGYFGLVVFRRGVGGFSGGRQLTEGGSGQEDGDVAFVSLYVGWAWNMCECVNGLGLGEMIWAFRKLI